MQNWCISLCFILTTSKFWDLSTLLATSQPQSYDLIPSYTPSILHSYSSILHWEVAIITQQPSVASTDIPIIPLFRISLGSEALLFLHHLWGYLHETSISDSFKHNVDILLWSFPILQAAASYRTNSFC